MSGRAAFESPALRRATWITWAAPPLWFVACAALWKNSGFVLLWPLLPFWLMLLVAAGTWMHLAVTRFRPGVAGLVALALLPVAAGAALTRLAGIEAGVTALLGVAVLLPSSHVRAGAISRMLGARAQAAGWVLAACVAAPLALPAIVLGIAIAFAGAWNGVTVGVAVPRWLGSGIALVILGMALPVPAWILGQRARRRARELVASLPPPEESSALADTPRAGRLVAICVIAACSIPLGAVGLLVAGALSDSSRGVAYAGLVAGALVGALLGRALLRSI